MPRRAFRALLVCALLAGGTPSMAQDHACSMQLSMDSLNTSGAQAGKTAQDFKAAFNGMSLEKAMSTVSTVGATLVGSSMADEMVADIESLKHLMALRDRVMDPASQGMVLAEMDAALREAGGRMRRISKAYSQVARMASAKDVQDIAVGAMAFADKLANEWSCQ